jgi:hypothetical protein
LGVSEIMSDEVQSPFLPGTNIQVAWDSTSLGWLKVCPRLYFYQMIEGWSSNEESVHLRFGQEYHHALQDYDISRSNGIKHNDAVHDTIRELLIRTADFDPDHKIKTRTSLVRTVIWYLDQFQREQTHTHILADGKPAVELSFRFELDWGPAQNKIVGKRVWDSGSQEMVIEPTDVTTMPQPYILSGHLDRVVSLNDDLFVMDRKAQPIDTHILGEHGWVKIRNLRVGSKIAGRDGTFYDVKGLYPKGLTRTFRVTFNDRTSVLCADDHLWAVGTNMLYDLKTITTLDLINKPHYIKYYVPLVKPIQHIEKDLPLDPYLLGVLLGDGYLNGNSIVLSSTKDWLVENVTDCLPLGDVIKKAHFSNNDWVISGGSTLNAIRELGLKGTLSRTKFIPRVYMFASEEQRRALLQGLLDTDGSFNSGSRTYSSMGHELIQDVCSLVRSLGGTARYTQRDCDSCYRAYLRMPEFLTGVGRRYITSVEEIDKQETCCIETTAPDGLYVTEHYIVTHNTTTAAPSSWFFSQFEPDNQMSLYSFAGQVVLGTPVRGVIIDAAQILEDESRFGRGFTYRTPAQTQEWLADLRYWLTLAEQYAVNNYWPMNDKSCDHYRSEKDDRTGCPFRGICGKDPSVRETFLKTQFTKLEEKDRWNPLKPR